MITFRARKDESGIEIMGDDWPTDADAALELSINKWKLVVSHPGIIDGGRRTCALCVLFYALECEGCLISAHTGIEYCADTPITEYEDALFEGDNGKMVEIAQRELDFLKSLRGGDSPQTP